MDELSTYLIELRGEAVERELNATSPVRVTVVRAGEGTTILSACTDQSGLMGVLRYLHGLGFALMSVRRGPRTASAGPSQR